VSRRSTVLVAAVLGALCLAGCGHASDGTPARSGTSASAQSGTSAGTGSASPGTEPAGSLPKVCPLLSTAEVTALTGEQVTVMTDDGGASGAARYCQWQLSQGQLTVAVTPETREGFDVRNKQAVAVPGLGTAAYLLSGHLFVWENGRDVDVYVSSKSSDEANLEVAKRTAAQFLPRLAAAAK
jgi:hypothetical protein